MKQTAFAASCILLTLMNLSGCASRNSATETRGAQQTDDRTQTERGLPAQSLLPGECGLFLWTRGNDASFVFFQSAGSDTAKAMVGENVFELDRTRATGSLIGEFLSEQAFSTRDGSGAIVGLTIEPGEEMEGGQRIRDGLMSTTTSEGWQVMQPVAGVRACIPE